MLSRTACARVLTTEEASALPLPCSTTIVVGLTTRPGAQLHELTSMTTNTGSFTHPEDAVRVADTMHFSCRALKFCRMGKRCRALSQ